MGRHLSVRVGPKGVVPPERHPQPSGSSSWDDVPQDLCRPELSVTPAYWEGRGPGRSHP